MVCDSSSYAQPTAIPGKRATSLSPFFLLLPALVAVGRSAHRCQQVVFSERLAAMSCSARRSQPVVFSERLAAMSCSAHRSQPVVFSKKARSHELLRSPLPAGLLQ